MNLIRFLTPTNIATERVKFFSSSQNYNPTFTYERGIGLEEWVERNPRYKLLKQATLGQDIETMVKVACRVFETQIVPDTLTLAKKIIETKPGSLEKFSTSDINKGFQGAFEYFGINYKVKLTNVQGFNFRPKYSERKILVGNQPNLQYFSVDGETKHEMTHVIRY